MIPRHIPSESSRRGDAGEAGDSAARAIPLLEGRGPLDGAAAAYVCRGFACQRPVTTAQELLREIETGVTPPT